jgi:hypothetical protein
VLSDSQKTTNEMGQFVEEKKFDDSHKATCVRTPAGRTLELIWAAHS